MKARRLTLAVEEGDMSEDKGFHTLTHVFTGVLVTEDMWQDKEEMKNRLAEMLEALGEKP